METLLIRADADSRIGTGHVMRCLALAQAWRERGGAVTFLTRCESEPLRERIKSEGFALVPLDNVHPDPEDLRRTLSLAEQGQDQRSDRQPGDVSSGQAGRLGWVILDGYHFSPDFQKSLRLSGVKLLVIDDMNHLPCYHADILVNQNIHGPGLGYSCDPETLRLMGPDYIMLRREFLKYRDVKREAPIRAGKILVTLGGADPDNVTLKVIQALNLLGELDLEARVVIGSANPHTPVIIEEIRRSSIRFQVLSAVEDMAGLMAWADLAVSAAGSTCWELCFMGVPFANIILADNQAGSAEWLGRRKISLNLGRHRDIEVKVLAGQLREFIGDQPGRRAMIQAGQALVDGLGADRIADRIIGFDKR